MKILANKVSYLLISGMLVLSGCGSKGDPGGKGDPGTTGANGLPGTNGANGSSGDAGPQGVPGANGADGADGADGDAGVSTAPLTITITNSLTTTPVAGAKVTLAPAPGALASLTASATGVATAADVPIGTYTLTITATGYTTATQTVTLIAAQAANIAVKLVPTANVVANAGADQTGLAPGAVATLAGTATAFDGSTGATYAWTQTEGATATITGATTAAPTVTMPTAAAIQAELIKDLAQPVRIAVVGINPHAIEVATTVGMTLTVTSGGKTYTDTVNLVATAPYQVTTGLRNVPIGIPQLLQSATAAAYAWTLVGPAGSAATLTDPTSQYPMITPDVAGAYTITEATTGGSIKLFAGKWAGAIGGLSATDGRPTAPDTCALCHNGATAPDQWAQWRNSGHAEIFSQNIDDPANHWSVTGCASCHTVGYNTLASAVNDGFDDVMTAAGWTQPKGAAGNYAAMFASTNANVVKLAGLANVQCDSCHGPSNSTGHSAGKLAAAIATDQPARVSLAAEVCGSCHGEPLRHGRYQQWQESGHGNSALAIQRGAAVVANDNATTGDNRANNCGRCHSAEGFVAWQEQSKARGMNFNALIQGAAGNATGAELRALGMTEDSVHSQTCATCHDPHDQGTTSGEPNTATLRVSGDVSVSAAGFALIGMGKGVLCATCHNSRNGLHNDATVPATTGVGTPHDSTVTDIILGENAYFVATGQRAGHSFVTNTCANCHMELTPPPAEFSYQLTGTNHSFEADLKICTNCHSTGAGGSIFDGESIQTSTKASLKNLVAYIGAQAYKALSGKLIWARAQRDSTGSAIYSSAANTYTTALDFTAASGNSLLSAELIENSANIRLTFASPITITWIETATTTSTSAVTTVLVSLANMRNDDGTGLAAATTQPLSVSGNMAKAIWNYIQLYREGSFGIHNPGFTSSVIGATLQKDLTL